MSIPRLQSGVYARVYARFYVYPQTSVWGLTNRRVIAGESSCAIP